MVCGGSMPPSIYRLSSTCKMTSLPVPAHMVTQAAIFTEDRVSSPQCSEYYFLYMSLYSSQIIAELPASSVIIIL